MITLSDDEVHYLKEVLSVIGGSRENSPREHTESIYDALFSATGSASKCTDTLFLSDRNRLWFVEYE